MQHPTVLVAALVACLAACGGGPVAEATTSGPAPQAADLAPDAGPAIAPRAAAAPVPVVSCVTPSPADPADPAQARAPVHQARSFAEELALPPPLTSGSGVVEPPDPFTF